MSIRVDLGRQLHEFARGLAGTQMDADGHAAEASHRLGPLVEVATKVAGEGSRQLL